MNAAQGAAGQLAGQAMNMYLQDPSMMYPQYYDQNGYAAMEQNPGYYLWSIEFQNHDSPNRYLIMK